MKRFRLALAALLCSCAASNAACYGGDIFQSCLDDQGNSYTVQRFGNSTSMQGYNSNTGSNWSQDSTRFGGSTFTNGTTNGRDWNETQQDFGGTRSIYGTDSRGRGYNYFCGPAGCF